MMVVCATVSSCARCQSRLPPQARFCSECGAWSAPAAQPIPDAYASTDDAPLASFYAMGPSAVRVRHETPPPIAQRPSSPNAPARAEPRSVRPTPSTQMRQREPIDVRQSALALSRTEMPDVPLIAVPPAPPLPTLPQREPAGETAPILPDRGAVLGSFASGGTPTVGGDRGASVPPTQDERRESLPTPARSVLASARPLGAFLVSFQYEPLGTFWPIAVGANSIGRAGGHAGLDVAIADATISSLHATLHVVRDELVVGAAIVSASIEDPGSRNGTFVNGNRLAPGVRTQLRHGDKLKIGGYETTVVLVP